MAENTKCQREKTYFTAGHIDSQRENVQFQVQTQLNISLRFCNSVRFAQTPGTA